MSGKNQGTRRKSCPGATLPISNFTRTELGSKGDLHGVRTNINLHCIEMSSSYHAENTPHLDPKTDNLRLCWDMIDFALRSIKQGIKFV
jgi:formyltetrahydrofolate synthetase